MGACVSVSLCVCVLARESVCICVVVSVCIRKRPMCVCVCMYVCVYVGRRLEEHWGFAINKLKSIRTLAALTRTRIFGSVNTVKLIGFLVV